MEMPSLLLLTVAIAALLMFLLRNKSVRNNNGLPPGPPKLPILGNLHQLGNSPHISLHLLSQRYGPIMYLQLGEIPTVVVSSPKMAEEVLKTHERALASRPRIFSAQHLFYNSTDIVFSPYGAYWRHIRKICILELLSVKRVQSFSYVREEEIARLVGRITESSPGKTNLSKMLNMYANDVLCRVAFGKDFSRGGEYDKHGFQKMLEEYQELLGGFSVGDFFPSLEFIHTITGLKARLQDTFRRFDSLFDEIIKEHFSQGKGSEARKDLVHVLLEIQKDGSAEMPLTMDNIKAIILDMFAAGTDTTFITLDWGMTELILNPKAMKRAQDEVRGVVGDRQYVQETDLPRLEYMKAVIKETFRLHPPAPVLVPRESMEEVTIDGYKFPTKTRFFVNAWSIGRDPKSWSDPETFWPERFLGSKIDYKGQDFELIPFGSGRRICPAITFGAASIEHALAQLLLSFDWELPPGVQGKDLDMTEAFGITMHRIENLVVIAKPCSSWTGKADVAK